MPSQAKSSNLLVVGLGNPGLSYEATRHNIGFAVLDAFIDASWKESRQGNALVANVSINGVDVHLLKPQTFMNLSGEAVRAYADYRHILPEEILVIHDEADIPFGEIRQKFGGGSAGHNGIKSLVQHLGSDAFWRIRFGIGKSDNPQMPLDAFVLAPWTNAEKQQLPLLIEQAIHLLHERIVTPPQEQS